VKESNGQVLLEVKNLRKFFPIRKGLLQKVVGHVRAVDDVNFFVNQGETLSLVGESGCGKTTTSRCILRAIDPTEGQILFRTGTVQWWMWLRCPARCRLRSQMQMVFRPLFLAQPTMVVGHCWRAAVSAWVKKSQAQDRVAELLRLVGMQGTCAASPNF
jgi:peptide/nickel transport system ATP-binding protein